MQMLDPKIDFNYIDTIFNAGINVAFLDTRF